MSWWWQPLEAAAQQQAGGPAFDPATSAGAYQGNLEDSRPQWAQWQLLDPPCSKPDQLSPPNPPPYDPATQCEVLYDHRDLWPWAAWQLLDEAEYRFPVVAPVTILYLTSDFEQETSEVVYRLRTFRSIDGAGVLEGEVVNEPGDQVEFNHIPTGKSLQWRSPPIKTAVEINGPLWLNGWYEEDSAAANTAVNLIDINPTIFGEELHSQGEFDVGPTRTRRLTISRTKDSGTRTLNPGQRFILRVDVGNSTDGSQPATFRVTMGFGSVVADVDGDAWLGFPQAIEFQADPTPAEFSSVLQEQPQLPWAQWRLEPDPGAEAPFQPPVPPFDPSTFDWSEQPQNPWPVWHLGPDIADYPEPPPFEPATHGFDWSEQPQLVFPPWTLGPDIPAMPLYPFHPGDGHFDWSEQPQQPWSRWADPADGSLEAPFQPPVPPFDPTTFPWQLALGEPWAEWSSPDIREAHFAGNLASWLFTTGDPGGGTGDAPPVLIDAESGDVYLYLGGVLIAPAH